MKIQIKNSSNKNLLKNFTQAILNIEEQKAVKGGEDTIIIEDVSEL